MTSKLDNPVWYSLSESHNEFAIKYDHIKFYHPDYCPFGGFDKTDGISNDIDDYSALIDNFFVVGEKPPLSQKVKLQNELVCLQMIAENNIEIEIQENIKKLSPENFGKLFHLVNLVQPGYFKSKTARLGNYYGIFKNEELIAVTGERMIMNDYTEVSAVVTHPDHAGKGYAKQLIAHTVNNIFERNKMPYLHVAEHNITAIKLYEKVGFTTRRKISFWNICR